MVMPLVNNPISFSDLQTEFGGNDPISFSEYYKDAGTGYTTNVVGSIPNTGTLISLNQFYGLTQYVPPASYPPPAVQTTYVSAPWGFGNTSYEWLTGASGTNLTRIGGSTFNHIGTYARSRTNFVNNQSLILQAKPGDALRFVIQNGASSTGDYEVNSLLLNIGGGWFNVASRGAYGGHTDTIDYTLSASLAPGSYGIFAYNNYTTAGSSSYASGNFYSLQVVN
jgi:hypothetical protein